MTHQAHRRRLLLCSWFCGLLALVAAPLRADKEQLDTLIAQTKSPDDAIRLTAIHELAGQGAAAVPTLAELLKSESPDVRAYAVRALGTIGAPAKTEAKSIVALLADPEVAVRRQAIGALKAIRPGPKVTIPLFVKLMQDADPGVRLRVMEAVADGKGEAVPALIEGLKNDGAAYWSCVILRDIGPDAVAAVPALVEKLKDRRPEVRREATLALAAIGAPAAAVKIAPLLADEHARIAATYALGALGKIPPDAESTIRANVKSNDHLLSTTSLWALARVHPRDMKLKQAVILQLVASLKDQDPFVRTAAARALASLPPSPEISGPIFEKALASADETTTHYMLDALAGQGALAVPKLIAALDHKSLRGPIAGVLARIGPAAAPATASLAKLLADQDPNVSTEAAHALAKIGPGAKAAVPELIEALKEAEGKPRHAAAYALGMIGPDAASATPALEEVIKGSDDSLSLLAAWALIKIRGASVETVAVVLPDLLAGLASPLAQSREAAAEALGSLGPLAKSSAEQLEHVAKDDSNEHVRAAAAKALKQIGG